MHTIHPDIDPRMTRSGIQQAAQGQKKFKSMNREAWIMNKMAHNQTIILPSGVKHTQSLVCEWE